jgi:hypothetical protein
MLSSPILGHVSGGNMKVPYGGTSPQDAPLTAGRKARKLGKSEAHRRGLRSLSILA